MATKVDYKFKPYTPTNLKLADTSATKETAQRKALETQKINLEARLRAQGIDPEQAGGEFDNRNIIEKALNLQQDQGLLLDFFEIINRPVEAVKAGIMAGIDGKNFVQGAWEGLSGQTVTSGSDFAEQALGIDIPDSGAGKFAASMAVDILLDPLTYLPAGFFTKRIGKLFRRTIQRANTALTGEMLQVLSKYGVLDDAGKAFTNLTDLELALAKMEKTKADEIIVELKKAADAGDNADIFFKGQAGGFDKEKYIDGTIDRKNYRNMTGFEERTNWLRETQAKIEQIKVQYADDTVRMNEEIRKLLPDSFNGKISDDALAEISLYDEVKSMADDLGVDYKTVMTTTSVKGKTDVGVYRRFRIGEEEFYVRVLSFDGKKAAGAYGHTAIATMTGKRFMFGGGVDDIYMENADELNKIFEEAGLSDEIDEVFQGGGRRPRGQNSLNPYKRIDELKAAGKLDDATATALKKRLDGVQKAMLRKKLGDSGYIYLATPGQKGVFAKFSDVEDYLDYSKTSIAWMNSGRPRARLLSLRKRDGSFNKNTIDALKDAGYDIVDSAGNMLDDTTLLDLMNDYNLRVAGTKVKQFRYSGKLTASQEAIERIIMDGKSIGLDKIFEESMTTGVRNVQVSLLDFWEETKGGTILGQLAKSINPYIKKFQSLFDPYARLPKEVQDAIRNMRGKLAVEFQTKTLRLAGLEEAFIKAFPDLSPQLITQIIEAGAYIDASGVVRYAARTMDAKDYIRHMLNSLDSGKPFQLRRFGDDAAQLNFLNQLNDIMDGAVGVDDLFSIVEKNGVKALNFTGTAEDLQKMLAYADLNLRPTMLDFGKINLSDDGIRVLKEWEDIGEAITLKTDVQKLLVQEGGFTNFLFNGAIDDTYMRHLLTKDAYEYMAKNMPGVLSKFAKPGGEVFQASKFIGTIDETNDFLRAYYDAPMDVFDPNFFRSTEDFLTRAFRNIEQGKMMDILLNSKDKYGEYLMRVVDNTRPVREALSPDDVMIKSFKEEFSTMYKNFSPEVQASFDRFLAAQGFGDGKAIVINRSMYGLVKEVEKAFVQLPDWVKMYDKFLNTWKGLTLITPGFHMRNLFGNSFNSYAVGMGLPAQIRYSRIAMLELNKFDEFQKILAQGGELTKAQQKIYDRVSKFRSSGLIQSHRGVRDLEQVKQAVEEALKKGKPGAREAYDKLVRFNFNLAEKMDDTQRYMLYRWKLDKTGDFQTAVDTVAESLFDYSRLTSFEKDVMKRIVPFYTFMKNNFVFQAKNIFRNPQQYAKAGRAYKYYLEDIAGYGTDDLPDYVTENMWLPIPVMITKNDKEGIAFLKANLPISDFTELVENPFKKGVISITAPLKLAIELGVGRDLFTGEPLEAFPGETSRMEPGTGILSGIRDERGTLALAKTPLMQKVMADIGLRTPLNLGSAALDFADTLIGYQGAPDGIGDFLQRAGVAGVQEVEKIELTRLYQDLEKLRELKKYYEQETGNQLPVLPRR